MIICEGMDNSGKTTLAKYLAENLPNAKLVPTHGPVKPEEVNTILRSIGMAVFYRKPLIYDRFPIISEMVYGEILRNGSAFNAVYDCDLLLGWLKACNPLIIYCRPSKETIFQSIKDRPQMAGVVKSKEALLSRYDDVMANLSAREFLRCNYDYTVGSSGVWSAVKYYLETVKEITL